MRLYETNIGTHAAHSHPYTRPQAAAAAVKPPQTAKTSGGVQGNPQSKIYHLPGCPGYKRSSPTTVVTFPTEAAARQAGYRKAKNCSRGTSRGAATVVQSSMRAVPAGDAVRFLLTR